MTKFLFLGLLVMLGGVSYAQAQSVPTATAAELALHRVEKLVILNKIAPEFQTNFRELTLEVLKPTNIADPTYRVILSQNPGADGMSDMVTILEDTNGKAISNKVMPMTATPNPVVWPNKDPLTLAEYSLHYLEDHYTSNDNSKALFTENLSGLAVSQETTSTGEMIAVFKLKNSVNSVLLVFKYTPDGKFISSELKM